MAAPTAEQLNQEMAKRIAEDVENGYGPVAYRGDHRREVAEAYGLELVGDDESTGCAIYTHPEAAQVGIPYYTWDPTNPDKYGWWADWGWVYEGAIGGEVDADALWYISRGCSPSDEDIIELLQARGWGPEDIAPYVHEIEVSETARYLDGKLCDISTAKEIEEIESPTPYAGDFDYVSGTIYQAPEGHRFAAGAGGARSIFARPEEGNPGWYSGGEGWVLLTD